MTAPSIAIVGMACRYPDARTPLELWENVLAGRRAFRRMPRQRLPLEDYASDDRTAPDLLYPMRAAVLDGYQFDRVRFRVSASTFNSVDLAHWLALDCAAQALDDAGFSDVSLLPREATGVLVGNTLTGEFSRAAALRVRWPYVRRAIDAALEVDGVSTERRSTILPRIEALFKAPFAPVDGETLAGSLSNTIAGRISNYFDLKGGGYTVDGACASSLLAVAQACSALAAGDLRVAIAGGVDLSLDPFELVGFAKAGALASDDMRIYDAAPTGFWPGEGAGFVVLMRESEAIALGRRIYAVVRGWGISSDGSGGMTRPEVEGQLLAIERAYARATVPLETVASFEGHGTGTAVGDATELAALSEARRRRSASGPAAIGSIKGNIGHTKAAAGIAGLLKAALSIHRQLIPPASGCRTPHALLTSPGAALCLATRAAPWPAEVPRRAAVSAMGFGGINAHVVLEGHGAAVSAPSAHDLMCARSTQDVELVLLSAAGWSDLGAHVDRLLSIAPDMSIAEVTDLAITSQRGVAQGRVRAAVLASTPEELVDQLVMLRAAIHDRGPVFDARRGLFAGTVEKRPRVAFVFPGQGAPVRTEGGLWSRRFAEVDDLYRRVQLSVGGDPADTTVAQPAIVTGGIAAVQMLRHFGLDADVGIGHSLGELTALWWDGAFGADRAIALAATRGRLMAAFAAGPGAMAALNTTAETAASLMAGTAATVAALNGPNEITVSGTANDITTVLTRARDRAIPAARLRVSHAFHSPLMAPVVPPWRSVLSAASIHALTGSVISTVTAERVRASDVSALLARQLCEPVRFTDALAAAGRVDLFIEAGPGRALAALAAAATGVSAVSTDAAGDSLRGLLTAVAGAFVLGAPLEPPRIADGRFARPFDLDRPKEFLINPCELTRGALVPAVAATRPEPAIIEPPSTQFGNEYAIAGDTCALLRTLVARAADLPIEAVAADARFLTDLHLNSITVSELLTAAARRIGALPPAAPTDYADASLAEAARALDDARSIESAGAPDPAPQGIDAWVRAFTMVEDSEPLRAVHRPERHGPWRVISSPHHPLYDCIRLQFASDEGGPGIVVCIDPEAEPPIELLLAAAQTASRERLPGRFVVVQQEPGAGGFARTLAHESPHIDLCIVTVDFSHPSAAAFVHAEACAVDGCVEVRYDTGGTRLVAKAELTPLTPSPEAVRLGPDDVLLVTGGGKGIAAECAMALARETGVRLALMGRSRPETDDVLSANLERLRRSGATVRYLTADVTDAAQVRAAVDTIREELGAVTAVLHAAGVNTPSLIAALDAGTIDAALRPKVDGARNVLSAVDPTRLRLFVAFGSVIARTGLPGEAHYALANERLRQLISRLATELPDCHALTIEWSVWAAAGMGERLGRLDALNRRGVTPITIERGTALFLEVLAARPRSSALLVTGRVGSSPLLQFARAELPLQRFLETVPVHYPGVELIGDARVSVDTDPYVTDHCLDDQLLFPAVMGLEAMVQVAMALRGVARPPVLGDVEFARPIVVPREGSLVLRTIALIDTDSRVRVALRTDTTSFTVDHFQAVCAWPKNVDTTSAPRERPAVSTLLPLDPAIDLYGSLLFQSGRFARVQRYRRLLATQCTADLTDQRCAWFGQYLPDALMLGDPGIRDAVLHGIQASIPHRRIVPVGVRRVVTSGALRGPCRIEAWETSSSGNEFIWNIDVLDADGRLVETWEQVRFRGIADLSARRLPAALLEPYLQRQFAALGHSSVRVDVESSEPGCRTRASRRRRRPDGKPDRVNDTCISTAHAGGLTLRVVAPGCIGCDVEPVVPRPPSVWRDLLGSERAAVADLIAGDRHEAADASATRVWAALESLKKAGASPGVPLVFRRALDDGWVRLQAGEYSVSTWIGGVDRYEQIALALATSEPHAAV